MFRQLASAKAVAPKFTRSYIAGQFTGAKKANGKYTVTLIEGDGIGVEISQAVKDIYA
ncbi:hypothetical protein OXX80_007967, partial [Metschnikowia pulcherrima]